MTTLIHDTVLAIISVLVDTVPALARIYSNSGSDLASLTTFFPHDALVLLQDRKSKIAKNVRANEKSSRGLVPATLNVSQWGKNALSKADEQYRIYYTFLIDMGFSGVVTDLQKDRFILNMTLHNLCERGEKYLKWKFAYIACVMFDQNEFVSQPDWVAPDDRPEFILGGAAGRFLRNASSDRSSYELRTKIGWNICQLKKGMPMVTDYMVAAGVASTIDALTSRPRITNGDSWTVEEESPDWDSNVPVINRDHIGELIRQCKRTVDEIFPDDWTPLINIQVPSISGHLSSKRKTVGALGAIVENREKFYDSIESSIDPALICTYHWLVGKEGRVSTHRGLKILPPAWPSQNCPCCGIAFERFCKYSGWCPSDSTIELPFDGFLPRVLQESIYYDDVNPASRDNIVAAVGLKEPFKVRVITGGPEGRYYRAKYIQKCVHSHLRKFPNASLIGETITGERLNSLLPQLLPGQFYVSGDYTAATDNLNPLLSDSVAEQIAFRGQWDESWTTEFVESLTRHNIATCKPSKLDPDHPLDRCLPQTWGQLMGSPTSFPVLCIVNLALTRAALEERAGHEISLRDTGMLINGDDIGFVTDSLGYEIWKRKTAAGGLSPSLGKNFCSERFIMLNSTFYDITVEDGSRHFTYRPYINYGLLECRNENGTPISDIGSSVCPSSDPRTPGIGSLADELIRGHPPALQITLLKRFLKNWKPALSRYCPRGMSYYTPVHLGGLGIPSIGTFQSSDGRGRYSRQQLVLASFLDHDHERAESLLSTSFVGRSESFSLWRQISKRYKTAMRGIGCRWVQADRGQVCPDELSPSMLALGYAGLSTTDAEEIADEGNGSRHAVWKREYELLFDHAAKTTFPPMDEALLASSRPWRRDYDCHYIVNPSPQVNLRLPSHQRLEQSLGPRCTLVCSPVTREFGLD